MTENEVIEACRRFARKRSRELGPARLVGLVTEDLEVTNTEAVRGYAGRWLVVFEGPSGFDTEPRFWVDDANGRVIWQNGPPPLWFNIVAIPIWFTVAPLSPVFDWAYKVWVYWRLPRCPRCRGKLKTRSAQQCTSCGEKWHDRNGK